MTEQNAIQTGLQFIEQIRELAQLHVPSGMIPGLVWLGVTLLALGLLLGIFGAAYARGLLSVTIGIIGYSVGIKVGHQFAFPPLAGGVASAVIFAVLGYAMHRLLVGLSVAALAASIGISTYGHDTVIPEYRNFVLSLPAPSTIDTTFTLPTIEQQVEHRSPTPLTYLKGFAEHLKSQFPAQARNSMIVIGLCALAGLILGMWLTRWSLIFSCAVVGTALITASLATFAERFTSPGWEDRLAQHPYGTLGFVASCFLLSALVQFRYTQPPKAVPKAAE